MLLSCTLTVDGGTPIMVDTVIQMIVVNVQYLSKGCSSRLHLKIE